MVLSDGTGCFGRLLDLSKVGFCVESSAALEPGDLIKVRVLGARLRGTISRVGGESSGGKFNV